MKCSFRSLAVIMCLLTSLEADAEVIYKFAGVVPNNVQYVGDFFKDRITPGETWQAELRMDVTKPDLDSDHRRGTFESPVLGGSFAFSGGYEGTINAGGRLSTYDNFLERDRVYVFNLGGRAANGDLLDSIHFATLSDDLSSLTTDAMPLPYTSFASQPAVDNSTLRMLQIGSFNYSVKYTASEANNTTFSAVPEPSTLGMCLIFGLIGGIIVWGKGKKV